ncbi:MAG: hypothetical protein IJU98_08210 [Synergistaceae bacterium]|nr:hypothetical protein [Synergistaceae bacterium]
MKNYDDMEMSDFTKETPLGVAMVRAAYDTGYDFFLNLYREEVQTTLRESDVEFLMGNIRFYLLDDNFSSLQEFSGAQNFPDGGTTFLLRCLDNTLTDEIQSLSGDCYRAMDRGVIDGYMDTMRNIINGLKPIGRYELCDGVAIEVYHIDHDRDETLASLVSDNEIENDDKLYPPNWCGIRHDGEQGKGFLYGRIFVPFSQILRG